MAETESTIGGLGKGENSLSCSVQSERNTGKERVGRAILATFFAALAPLSFGYCLGYSSSALEDLANESTAVRLNDIQGSWFSSLFPLGAIFGGPIGGWAIDRFGRKCTIMFGVVPFQLGWLLLAYAQNRGMLYAGRAITGLACGIISLAVPVYVAETVAARIRGALGSVFQLAVTAGLLLAYVMGVLCRWRWLAFVGAIPSALLVILMIPMPETPRWYLGKNRRSDALCALLWLRGPDADIDKECTTIEETFENYERVQLRDLLSPVIAKPLIISTGLMVFQQFSGINAVIFNAAQIFASAGFSNGKLVSITVGLVQFVFTGVACLLMDKAGRRILLWTTALGMSASLVALGVYFQIYIPPTTPPPATDGSLASDAVSLLGSISHSVPAKSISWLSILCIILYNLMFSLAWGPVPWLIMSEIFPLRVRGPASSFATLTNWTLAFIVTNTFESMVTTLTNQGVYWFYAGFCLLGFIFVYFLVPETKGKTLEEIEAMFDKDKGYQEIK